MATLDAAQLARLRRKLGDTTSPYAFADPDLQDIYDQAAGDWNQTIVDALDELLINAAKFADYTQNETDEKRSQIFKQLKEMRDLYRAKTGATNQVIIAGMRKVPPTQKDVPYDNGELDRNDPYRTR